MFRCDRCGSEFNPIRVPPTETCPRCRAREGATVQLTFAPFSAKTPEADDAGRKTQGKRHGTKESRGRDSEDAGS